MLCPGGWRAVECYPLTALLLRAPLPRARVASETYTRRMRKSLRFHLVGAAPPVRHAAAVGAFVCSGRGGPNVEPANRGRVGPVVVVSRNAGGRRQRHGDHGRSAD